MASSTENITRACADCRKLIEQLLETMEELDRAVAVQSPRAAVLRDKVAKLKADTEMRFFKAMDSLGGDRR